MEDESGGGCSWAVAAARVGIRRLARPSIGGQCWDRVVDDDDGSADWEGDDETSGWWRQAVPPVAALR
jgi:hypothetical protein